jgi:hypothetical protein
MSPEDGSSHAAHPEDLPRDRNLSASTTPVPSGGHIRVRPQTVSAEDPDQPKPAEAGNDGSTSARGETTPDLKMPAPRPRGHGNCSAPGQVGGPHATPNPGPGAKEPGAGGAARSLS